MSQINSVHLVPDDTDRIVADIRSHRFKTPAGYSDEEFAAERRALLQFLQEKTGHSLKDRIVMTGHQPVFFHPGLLFKDLILAELAERTNSSAVHMVVDTDQTGDEFKIPYKKDSWPDLEIFPFHSREHNTFSKTKTTARDREYLATIYERIGDSECFLPKDKKESCRDIVSGIVASAGQAEYFYEIPEKMRLDYLESRGLDIVSFPVSLMVQSQTFKNFVEKVRERLDDFRDQHNSHLFEYRMLRNIKNQAQPVPGLKHGEMPFWVVDSKGNRSHMFRDTPNHDIIPRAITLTLFVRIFLADLFIHGIGGGRYEQIAAKILNSFFGIPGAPFMVASITMHLDKNDCFPSHLPDRRELHVLERKYDHSPEKLAPHLPESKEKMALVKKLGEARSGRRTIHLEIMAMNERIRDKIPEIKKEMEEMEKNMPVYDRLRRIASARDLPFFFYNLDELENYVKKLP